MTKKNQRYIIALLVCILLYLFVCQLLAIWPFTIDDMYISLRYAKNLVHGYGIRWNPHELPVEGYSNFSFVILAAFAIKLGFDPILFLKLLGIVGLFFTAVSVYFLTRLWMNSWQSLLPVMALLLYKGQIIWSVSGLETTVFQALLGFSLYFLLKGQGYKDYPQIRGIRQAYCYYLSAICLLIASLTRPEGPFFIIAFFLIALWDTPAKQRLITFYQLLKAALLFVSIYTPYFLWRWIYFDQILPNSVLCKGIRLTTGWLLDKAYLSLSWPFLFLTLFAIYHAKDKRPYYFLMPSFIYLILLSHADPIVAFDNRLFLPAFQLLLPAAFYGLSQLLERMTGQNNNAILMIVSFLIGFFFIPGMTLNEYRYFSRNPQAGTALRIQVVNWLNKHISADSQVVLGDCGIIPYLTNYAFIDAYCLNNRQMTRYPAANRYALFCQDMLQLKPEVVIVNSIVEKKQVIYSVPDACLKKQFSHHPHYKLSAIFQTNNEASRYRYEIFTRITTNIKR